jgi:hypothetical protein
MVPDRWSRPLVSKWPQVRVMVATGDKARVVMEVDPEPRPVGIPREL